MPRDPSTPKYSALRVLALTGRQEIAEASHKSEPLAAVLRDLDGHPERGLVVAEAADVGACLGEHVLGSEAKLFRGRVEVLYNQ